MKYEGVRNLRKRLTRRDILTIPNGMSLFRIFLVPVIAGLYLRGMRLLTILMIFLSALTDVADGYVARRFHMVSDLGKILDPIADKLTLLSLSVCLAEKHSEFLFLLFLMILKEVILFAFGYISLKYFDAVHSSRWYGKACTAILYFSFVVFILFPNLSDGTEKGILILCLAAVASSALLYVGMYLQKWKKKEQKSDL